MSLYLGDKKVSVNLNGTPYFVNFFMAENITKSLRVLTLEGYMLKDADGVYITLKREGDD